jgi:dihydroorotate dehydrogenase
MFYKILRNCLFCLPGEVSHKLSLTVLNLIFKNKKILNHFLSKAPVCQVVKSGITFKNPVGLAGGFDKNGEYIDTFFALGFGFVEVGTVTPVAQLGNKKPRLFRLTKYKALINRMGFNNKGVDYLVGQLKKRKVPGVVGVNVGKNKLTPMNQAVNDYIQAVEKVYLYADYITINISSPNTPGLRQLQSFESLTPLLSGVSAVRAQLEAEHDKRVPIFIKITVDLADDDVCALYGLVVSYDFNGIITSNTTLSRAGVESHKKSQCAGGLSGEPLCNSANLQMKLLNSVRKNDNLTFIGSGGIVKAKDAIERRHAGADLVQLYTGLVYTGPGLIHDIVALWKDE